MARVSAGIGAYGASMSIVTREEAPRLESPVTRPTSTPEIRTSAPGTSRPLSGNSAWTSYPRGANGIVPANWVHTNRIRPRQESVKATASITAPRLGAWVVMRAVPASWLASERRAQDLVQDRPHGQGLQGLAAADEERPPHRAVGV